MVLQQIFAATHHSVHVAVFHLWFLLELPNNWYALRYDTCTCVTLLAEIGRFCPMLHISRPIIDTIWTLPFGSLLANGRMLRGESHCSNNDGCEF